ncbi:MAG TPA: hypothetical protein VN840_01025 [Streptosporangiaceae bacterium]|nr:hypothetical protein [Streptosporangiaceae bacterium]
MTAEEDSAGFSAGLLAFLSADEMDGPGAENRPAEEGIRPVAECRLFVEQTVRGAHSRLIEEGGVQFLRAESYWLVVDDLAPMARRRENIDLVRLQLVKFYFTLSELPHSCSYAEVRVRIRLNPPAPVLQLRPYLKLASSESSRLFSQELTPTLAKLVRLGTKRSTSGRTGQTGEQPIVTGLDLGDAGFGWTFQAQEGTPLLPRTEYTIAVLELPAGTTRLEGVFDAEAIITHTMLSVFHPRKATPADPPVPFQLELSAGGGRPGTAAPAG